MSERRREIALDRFWEKYGPQFVIDFLEQYKGTGLDDSIIRILIRKHHSFIEFRDLEDTSIRNYKRDVINVIEIMGDGDSYYLADWLMSNSDEFKRFVDNAFIDYYGE